MDSNQIEVGKCYLATAGQIRRVLQVMPDGRVLFDKRGANASGIYWLAGGIIEAGVFASLAEREVPCDWTAGQEES